MTPDSQSSTLYMNYQWGRIMLRLFNVTILTVLLMTSNAFAGFSSYESFYRSDSIVAPIQVKDNGIYNLVISIQILAEPYDQKIYKSDAYKDFIRRFHVEWSGVALQQILKTKEPAISDLVTLKSNIESELTKLSDALKSKYSLEKNIEVVFSLSNFYILEPRSK